MFFLEDELSVSAMKREAVRIYEQLAEATAKRDELQAEERQRGTPQQEREHLLQQVRLTTFTFCVHVHSHESIKKSYPFKPKL